MASGHAPRVLFAQLMVLTGWAVVDLRLVRVTSAPIQAKALEIYLC